MNTDKYELVHYKLETPITISPDKPCVLVMEDSKEFFATVSELKRQFEGGEGEFLLMCGGRRLSFEKVGEFVSDIFSLEFEDKKMSSALYKYLEQVASDGELKLLQNGAVTALAEYYRELFDRTSLSLTFDDFDTAEMLKVGKVRLLQEYDGILEKTVCYLDSLTELKGSRFFVFVHLKSVLSDEELKKLYRHCALEKVGLLLIESNVGRGILKEENFRIITSDLCEIVDR